MIFPIEITKGGNLYGFCPGKVRWDQRNGRLFRILMTAAESGTMLVEGGVSDQPDWWVELVGWFVPVLRNMTFYSRVNTIAEGMKAKGGPGLGGNSGRPPNQDQRGRR